MKKFCARMMLPGVHRSDVPSLKLFWIAGTPCRLTAYARYLSRSTRSSRSFWEAVDGLGLPAPPAPPSSPSSAAPSGPPVPLPCPPLLGAREQGCSSLLLLVDFKKEGAPPAVGNRPNLDARAEDRDDGHTVPMDIPVHGPAPLPLLPPLPLLLPCLSCLSRSPAPGLALCQSLA